MASASSSRDSVESTETGRGGSSFERDVLLRLLEIARPERGLILASAATLAVTSSITLVLPYACGSVLDAAVLEASNPTGNFDPYKVSLGLFGLTGTAGVFVYARGVMLNIAGNRIVSRMRRGLYGSILSQEAAFLDSSKRGDLISRLSNDSFFVRSAVTTEVVAGLRGLVMSAGSTGLLFYTSPSLAVVSLLSIPPVFVAARVVGRSLRRKQKRVQELHGNATDIAEEAIGGMRTVHLFNSERRELERYSSAVTSAHDAEIDVGKTRAKFDGAVHVAANGAVLLVLGYGGTLVLGGEMSPGDLTGFLMYSLLMAGNISGLSTTYAEVVKSLAAAGRVFEIMDRVPSIPSSLDSKSECKEVSLEGDHKPKSIRFENVRFAYPQRADVPVLMDFELDIKAGENIALVGGSGSGKSTVALLLSRLYDLNSGTIKVDGSDIMSMDPSALRSQIGVVSQDPLLFSGTIAENIRYGRPNASRAEVETAASRARVAEFTSDLPHGLDTRVGSRGTQLSGGQRQRVAIARVMLRDPPICVLDEATSALDARSEFHINQALKEMTQGRTVISIAHRLSTSE